MRWPPSWPRACGGAQRQAGRGRRAKPVLDALASPRTTIQRRRCASSARAWSRRRSSKLLQEAQVVVVEQPQVGDAVLEHRHPFDAQPEGEALDALGVVAVL